MKYNVMVSGTYLVVIFVITGESTITQEEAEAYLGQQLVVNIGKHNEKGSTIRCTFIVNHTDLCFTCISIKGRSSTQ